MHEDRFLSNQQLACKAAYESFCRGLKGAESAQALLLQKMVRSGVRSAFGAEHDMSAVHDIASFRQRVPLRRYEDFKPYVDRLVANEKNVLCEAEVFQYISSSGSTGAAKVIPVTREYFSDAFNPFFMTYLHGAMSLYPDWLEQGARTLNFKWDPLREKPVLGNGHTHVGMSQLNLAQEFDSPVFAEPGTTAPWAVVPADIGQDLDRLYYRLRVACEYEVTQLVGINPAIIAALPRLLEDYADRLVEELETGTFAGKRIAAPNLTLASRIRQLRREQGRLLPRHLWSGMRRIICWDEGISGFYLDRVADLFGDDVRILPAPLAASEAPLAVHLVHEGVRGVMPYNAVFYEFLDVQKGESQTPLLLHELKIGGQYAVVVTQQSGFYRYVLGDVLEVTGYLEGVPTVAYRGRYKPGGAPEGVLLRFMEQVAYAYDLDLVNFTFEESSGGSLTLLLELHQPKSAEEITRLSARIRQDFLSFPGRAPYQLKAVRQVLTGHFHSQWKGRVEAGLRPPQAKDRVVCPA
ncbi:MAG: GH3 auxin-responsive promoter family protein [Moraxellaceae bacterium]|nr:GH3 auxin-responsive promoter family protein [Moraxellaceae bacterium]